MFVLQIKNPVPSYGTGFFYGNVVKNAGHSLLKYSDMNLHTRAKRTDIVNFIDLKFKIEFL